MRALVYSKNRAAQLDLLLRSIEVYAPWIKPKVLYVCSPYHDDSYAICADEHPEAAFIYEDDFEAQTRRFLAGTSRFIWLVDDAVFFRSVSEPQELPWTSRIAGGHRWRDYPPTSERGYPLAVCDTAYETDTILPLLDFSFSNPNQLERGMRDRSDRFTPETIHGEQWQSLCTIESNAVSVDSLNPTIGEDVDLLCDRYMDGERLAFLSPKEITLDDPHLRIPLVWA